MNKLIDLNSPYIKPVLPILLKDRTTKKNIIWATDNYSQCGEDYYEISEINEESLYALDRGDSIYSYESAFQPRVYKSQLMQKSRTKTKAEVFTPVWICNLMNSHCDEVWFGYKDVFNKPSEDNKKWTKTRKIVFPDDKDWKEYVDSRRIEITCGEAPYLVSRYDTTTGAIIPIGKRIGMLDRKLRVIDENAETKDEWFFWVVRAYQATYGYEWQGDNLLIARINLLLSFVEYMKNKWNEEPTEKELEKIATIISWNIWQMDGLKNTTICNQELEKKIVERKINDYNSKLFRLQNLKFESRVLTENVIALAELNQDLISGTRYTPKQFAKIIVDCNYLCGLAVSLTNYSTVKIKNEKKVIEDLCKRRDKLIAKYTKEKGIWTNYQFTEPQFCKIRKWSKRADGELQGPSIEFRELREE